MSDEDSKLQNEDIDMSKVDESNSEISTNDPETTNSLSVQYSPEEESNICSKQPSSLDNRSDDDSMRSRFSDSSSDDGRHQHPQSSSFRDASPTASNHIGNESNAKPTFASMTWEQLCNVDFGPMDDPDADMNLTSALRIQEEKKRGFYYEQRPRSPFRALGPKGDEDLYLQSVRSCLGQNLNDFDARYEPIRHANGVPSPLRKMRSVDELSPESPVEQEWNLLGDERALLGPSISKGEQTTPDAEGDVADSPASAPVTYDREDGTEQRRSPPDTEDCHESVLETAPQLQISTDFTNIENDEAKQPPRDDGNSSKEDVQDERPTSAEELEMMTKISPNTSFEMIQEVYERLKASSFNDPAETLKFKRQLIEHQQRGAKYNGLDDNVLREAENSENPSLAEMYKKVAAHVYRVQRDEARDQAHSNWEQVLEIEELQQGDQYEISMLKHTLEERDEKLKREQDALAEKSREAQLWKQAYEKFEPIAKREFDRRERLATGENERTDAETQTEQYEMKSSSTQTIRLGSLTSKQLHDECNKLTTDYENLQRASEERKTEMGIIRDRNQILEERMAKSNEAWQIIADACGSVDVWEAKKYITVLQDELKSATEEKDRLKSLMASVKKWHEEQEEESGKGPTYASSPTSAPPQPAETPSSLSPSNHPIVNVNVVPKKPHWIEREKQIRNAEEWKRNRDAIMRQYFLDAAVRKRTHEREWEEKVKHLSPRRAVFQV